MSVLIAAFLTLAVIVCAVLAAIWDLRYLRIPNKMPVFIALAFVPVFLLQPEIFAMWWQHLLAGGLVLVFGYIFFVTGIFGGGDSKLLAALALWTGLSGLPPFLIVMSLVGGVLALCAIIFRKFTLFPKASGPGWVSQVQQGRSAVPYGVAISTGAIWAMVQIGFLSKILSDLKSIFYAAV